MLRSTNERRAVPDLCVARIAGWFLFEILICFWNEKTDAPFAFGAADRLRGGAR